MRSRGVCWGGGARCGAVDDIRRGCGVPWAHAVQKQIGARRAACGAALPDPNAPRPRVPLVVPCRALSALALRVHTGAPHSIVLGAMSYLCASGTSCAEAK